MSPRAFIGCALLLACDAQATDEYGGEPLLRVRGRVELLEGRSEDTALLPALAFRGADGNFRLIDVAVEGAFPAEFRMDVLEPPPAESLLLTDDAPSGPRAAVGYITAVSADLPRVFTYAEYEGPSTYELVDGGPPAPAPEPETDPPFWASFAGLSQNYLVVYLEEAVPARTYFARTFGDHTAAVAAGYHLIALRPETLEEAAANDACHAAALALAIERLNAAHGSFFEEEDFEQYCDPNDPGCAFNHEGELEQLERLARDELGCREGTHVLTRVAQPESERITVRIGPEVAPL